MVLFASQSGFARYVGVVVIPGDHRQLQGELLVLIAAATTLFSARPTPGW